MATIDETGYILKTQNEWYEEERQLYLDIDTDWNLDASTPDGLKLASDAEIWANLDENAQRAYDSKDPNKAKGRDLEILCALNGVEKSIGTYSTANVTIEGAFNIGDTVPIGSRVQSTEDDTYWEVTTVPSPSDEFGVIGAVVTCQTIGPITASSRTLTKIVDTQPGWRSVHNGFAATPGTGPQNDSSLRLERKLSVAKSSENQIETVIANLFDVDGVTHVRAKDNATDLASEGGLVPARNTYAIVKGGSDDDVARAIFNSRSTGTPWFNGLGTAKTVTVQSLKYPSHSESIKFMRPTLVNIVINIELTNHSSLPALVDDEIKDAIVEYATGSFGSDSEGFDLTGFNIGEPVAVSRIYVPINYVLGPYGTNAYVSGLTLNGFSNLSIYDIEFYEISNWLTSNITITRA
jgi:uncharacterized phage protein gp47/JayE